MQAVAQLVESRTIGQNLHHIESEPLDFALPPYLPVRAHVFLFFLLGGAAGFFLGFLGLFLKDLYHGFPVSSDTLLTLRYPYSGSISFHANGTDIENLPGADLESLRQTLLQFGTEPSSQVIGLLANQGPDYAHLFARLLARRGRKVLLMPCDSLSTASEEDSLGWQQILNDPSAPLPIRRMNDYDLLPGGGYSRFSAELIQSSAFEELLHRLQTRYDHILLLTFSPILGAQCKSILAKSQFAVVTLGHEPTEMLTPFVHWAYHEGRCRLTFLTVSCLS
jgi:hypothetical protein